MAKIFASFVLGGSDETTVLHYIEVLPKIFLDFILSAPRMVGSSFNRKGGG